jgi:large subunit ribosomal protein L10
MDNPRPEKVAVVDEVREKFAEADAVLFTEYRGLTVRDLQELRTAMRAAGGEYKVYKNTLVRRATSDLDADLDGWLLGPTAIAFVRSAADGTPGDAVTVAKALKSFAKANPNLVIKGGLLGAAVIDAKGVLQLADVPPREELLARLAGGLAAPMRNMAGVLQALPLKMAYALQALIEQGGAPGAPAAEAPAAEPEASDTEAPEAEASDTEAPEAEASDTEAPEAEASDTEAPEAEASDTEAVEAEASESEPTESDDNDEE